MRWDEHRRHRWDRRRHGPPPFVRRMGCAFAVMMILAAIGASTLVSLVSRAPQRAVSILTVASIVAAALAAAFVLVLRRVTRVFREQDRLRRQLMADVAHELRTPLAILQGRIEGLLDGVYARDDARLGELLDETQHLSRLVEDLRTLANAEAGALDLRKEPVDLAELLRDVAASFEVPIEVHAPDEMPLLDLDPMRIREVFLNLLANAVRHTPSGGTISLDAETHTRHVVVVVRDTGSGIAPEDLPRIFDRFQKGRDSHGSGLGLAIARDLVRAHGGEIHVGSEVGRGTTVTVRFGR